MTDPSVSSKTRHVFYHSLFLSVVSLTIRMGKEFPLEVLHISDLALRLLLLSWRNDLLATRGLLPHRPLPQHLQMQRLSIVSELLSSAGYPEAERGGPFQPYAIPSAAARELVELVVATLTEALQGEDEVSQSVSTALRSALSALRKIGNSSSPVIQEACTRLHLISSRLFFEVQKALPYEEGIASSAGLTAEEKADRDAELMRKVSYDHVIISQLSVADVSPPLSFFSPFSLVL